MPPCSRGALSLAVENEVTAGIEQLELAREIAGRYRDALLPGAASVVARRQEEGNFMLRSVFELLQARRNEYDAWQAYLESVRNCWVAWTGLRAATGGSLPGDGEVRTFTIGVDEILAPAAGA